MKTLLARYPCNKRTVNPPDKHSAGNEHSRAVGKGVDEGANDLDERSTTWPRT